MAFSIWLMRCTGVEHMIEPYAIRRPAAGQSRTSLAALPVARQNRTCDVGRHIPPVDNFRLGHPVSEASYFFPAQAVDGISAGKKLAARPISELSTALSPGHAQGLRRVCTGCPQSCAQPDWTSADARTTLWSRVLVVPVR